MSEDDLGRGEHDEPAEQHETAPGDEDADDAERTENRCNVGHGSWAMI